MALSDLWTGTCPWCGSTWDDGRDIHSVERRHCLRCDATFEKTCPSCHHVGRSLGFSRTNDEYGCDRCGNTWTPEEFLDEFGP